MHHQCHHQWRWQCGDRERGCKFFAGEPSEGNQHSGGGGHGNPWKADCAPGTRRRLRRQVSGEAQAGSRRLPSRLGSNRCQCKCPAIHHHFQFSLHFLHSLHSLPVSQADLSKPETIPATLVGIHTIIDCATGRPEEPIKTVTNLLHSPFHFISFTHIYPIHTYKHR